RLALHQGQPRPSARQFHSGRRIKMSSQREDSIPHELRTAAEPRQNRLYPVRLSHVEQVNSSVRLLQFAIPPQESSDTQQPFSFLPGQWLDVHIPSISQAGGFTITSTPADAQLLPPLDSPPGPMASEEADITIASQGRAPYVELAVQESPSNPSAAWLWKPKEDILGKEINIRVGGSFVWPPTGVDIHDVHNVVFVAGGVGINPLISILSHLNSQSFNAHSINVHFLYSSRLPTGFETASSQAVLEQVLFLSRLRQIIRTQLHLQKFNISLQLFLTNLKSSLIEPSGRPADLAIHSRRIGEDDLRAAITDRDGKRNPQKTVSYVCGPPDMTDDMVDRLKKVLDDPEGQRIFYEKWW
ncbi:Riboflavin synthase-like beta-barrel, partial [Penicillium cosmopolitanum]